MTDTGIMWAGLHRAASESLVHATRDDDPRCCLVFANEAIQAGKESLEHARNNRQRAVTASLLSAAEKIKRLAETEAEGVHSPDF